VPCITKPNFGVPTSNGGGNMSSYVNNENKNLKNSQQYIEEAREEQHHVDEMNDSYRKRVLEYIKMIIVLCIGLFFLYLIRVMDENEWFPRGGLELMTIVIISVACIVEYILYFGIPMVYTGIANRSLINFDEVQFQGPQIGNNVNIGPSVNPTPTGVTPTGMSKPQCNPQVHN
jgi:hypothetical protein